MFVVIIYFFFNIMTNNYYYTLSYIIKHFHVCLYMKNKYFSYTSSRITRYTFSCMKEILLVYNFLYTNNISFIHENVRLHKRIYNDNKHFCYT